MGMKILLATDGSSHSLAAAAFLRAFPLPDDVEVTVLSVVEPLQPLAHDLHIADEGERRVLDGILAQQREMAGGFAGEAAAALSPRGWKLTCLVREGNAALAIVDAAGDLACDLVVTGFQGAGALERFLLGGVCHQVVKHAPCSVLVVRPPAPAEDGTPPEPDARLRILLAYDGSPPARLAADTLAALPLGERAEVVVLSVLTVATTLFGADLRERISGAWQAYRNTAEGYLEAVAEQLRAATPHVETRLLDGGANASDDLLAEIAHTRADVVFAGHTGRSGLRGFLLGSVARRLVEHAACSVWIARAPGSGDGASADEPAP